MGVLRLSGRKRTPVMLRARWMVRSGGDAGVGGRGFAGVGGGMIQGADGRGVAVGRGG